MECNLNPASPLDITHNTPRLIARALKEHFGSLTKAHTQYPLEEGDHVPSIVTLRNIASGKTLPNEATIAFLVEYFIVLGGQLEGNPSFSEIPDVIDSIIEKVQEKRKENKEHSVTAHEMRKLGNLIRDMENRNWHAMMSHSHRPALASK